MTTVLENIVLTRNTEFVNPISGVSVIVEKGTKLKIKRASLGVMIVDCDKEELIGYSRATGEFIVDYIDDLTKQNFYSKEAKMVSTYKSDKLKKTLAKEFDRYYEIV